MRNKASPKSKKDQAKRDTIASIIFLSLVVIGILVAIIYSSGVFSNLSYGDRKINMDTKNHGGILMIKLQIKLIQILKTKNILKPLKFSMSAISTS